MKRISAEFLLQIIILIVCFIIFIFSYSNISVKAQLESSCPVPEFMSSPPIFRDAWSPNTNAIVKIDNRWNSDERGAIEVGINEWEGTVPAQTCSNVMFQNPGTITINDANISNEFPLDSQDAIFDSLRLWRDANHNGISEAGELYRLTDLGLVEIDLKYKKSRRVDEHGNEFKYRAKVKDSHGAQLGRWAWDVFLVTQP